MVMALALAGCISASVSSGDAATGSGGGSVASRVLAPAPSPLTELSVDRGAAFYHDYRRVTRIGLRGARRSTLYPGAPATRVVRLAAGGGRVAIGTESKVVSSATEPSLASSVLVASSAGGPPTEIVAADFRVQPTPEERVLCGNAVALQDVSAQGEVLVERRTLPCDGGAPSLVYERYGPGGPVEVARFPGNANVLYEDNPTARLEGGRLLLERRGELRVFDLAGGSSRLIPKRVRGFVRESVELDPLGNLLVIEERRSGNRPPELRVRARLVRPSDPATGGLVRTYPLGSGAALLCGTKILEAVSRGRTTQLYVRRDLRAPARRVDRARVARGYELITAGCDARTLVVEVFRAGRRSTLEAFSLP